MLQTKKKRRKAAVGLPRDQVIAAAIGGRETLLGREAVVKRPRGLQTYVVTGIRPHINVNGFASAIVEWVSHCAVCGAEFSCESGVNPINAPSTCQAHRLNVYGQNRKARIRANLAKIHHQIDA